MPTAYRSVTIDWLPRSQAEWATFTAARREAGRLWSDLVERHLRIRRRQLKWPSEKRWRKWAKGKYPNLHSQSVQLIISKFCEALASAATLRRNGHPEANYPHKPREFHGVPHTNQGAVVRDANLRLSNGSAGYLYIPLPRTIVLPGRLMEARLTYGAVILVCQCEAQITPTGPILGIDLGVNTLLAATDGQTAVLVSGREAKATVQWRAKRLASLRSKQSNCHRGSRQYGRLQRRKHKLLKKSENRIKDVTHKATRIVADTFPGATCYVGKPFNDAAQKLGRRQAQQVSEACNSRIITQLDYKTAGAITVGEAYSSQTCPVCGTRNKCRRTYRCCDCGFTAPRDVVGSANIRCIGMRGELVPGCDVPNVWTYKYPGVIAPGSSGGRPACSSRKREAA